MVKLDNDLKINVGKVIYITEEWHEILKRKSKLKDYPYTFNVIDIKLAPQTNENVYICESNVLKNGNTVKIAISHNIMKYLFATEVEDTNIGFSFNEYLPLDNTVIIITSIKNMGNIQVGLFHSCIKECLLEGYDNKFMFIDFQIDYKNNNSFTDLFYYTSRHKATWKFLFHEDTTSMTNYEKVFQNTFVHKSYVEQSCKKLAHYLTEIGAVEHAKALLKRSTLHDNSKFTNEDELRSFAEIINDQQSLKDYSKSLSPLSKEYLKLHYKNNSHHPEHYTSPADMSRLDVMEMVCDWHARSVQYGTDLLKFVNESHIPRFKFPKWMIPEILHYCDVLLRD